MARLCARPGCSTPAAATFNFDGLNRIVWINAVGDAPRYSAGDLCWRHADRLRPPRNWELRDTRRAQPASHPGPAAPTRHLAPSAANGSNPDASARPAAATDRRPGSAAPAALLASERRGGPRVEAPASTPLLARAFRGVGRG